MGTTVVSKNKGNKLNTDTANRGLKTRSGVFGPAAQESAKKSNIKLSKTFQKKTSDDKNLATPSKRHSPEPRPPGHDLRKTAAGVEAFRQAMLNAPVKKPRPLQETKETPKSTAKQPEAPKLDKSVADQARTSNKYTEGPKSLSDIQGSKALQVGHKGQAVRELQEKLNAKGANLKVDGFLGPKTEAAIKAFQKSNGQKESGLVDGNTLKSLKEGKAIDPKELASRMPKESVSSKTTTKGNGGRKVEQWRSMAEKEVAKHGLPKDAVNHVLALIKQESGGNAKIKGDQGHAVGLFQLHDKGVGKGLSVAARQNPQTQFDKMMPLIKNAYNKGVSRGLSGGALTSYIAKLAERPASIHLPKYAAAYNSIVGN